MSQYGKLSPDGVRAPSLEKLKEVGITMYEIESLWRGKPGQAPHAVAATEAGLLPNRFSAPKISEEALFHFLIDLIRDPELRRLPSKADFMYAHKNIENFPSRTTFRKTLGNLNEMFQKLLRWVRDKDEYRDIKEILESQCDEDGSVMSADEDDDEDIDDLERHFADTKILRARDVR